MTHPTTPMRVALTLGTIACVFGTTAVSASANTNDDPCKSSLVRQKVASIHRASLTVLRHGVGETPDEEAAHEAWLGLISDQTIVIGLCDDPRVLAQACPSCVDSELPVSKRTAYAYLIMWLSTRPDAGTLFDARHYSINYTARLSR